MAYFIAYTLTTITLLPCFYLGVYFFNKVLVVHRFKFKRRIKVISMTPHEFGKYVFNEAIRLDREKREQEVLEQELQLAKFNKQVH